MLGFLSLFFIMTSHSKTYRQVSVRTTENRSLAVCHAFKINKNVIRMAGVIRSENIQPFEQLQLSVRKMFICKDSCGFKFRIRKDSAFQTKEFFCTAKGIRSERFRFAQLSHFCHRAVTAPLFVGQRIFQRYCSTDVKAFVVSFTFTAHKSTNKMRNKTFRSIAKLFIT